MHLFPQQAPDFDDPVAMLRACHGKIERFLALLGRLSGYLKEHGADDSAQTAAAQILRYFQVAAPLHHQDEEEDFFPLLRRYLPEYADVLTALADEHRILEEAWSVLEPRLQYLETFDSTAEAAAERFIAAYQKHIQTENTLFVQAEKRIPPAALYAIGRNMTARRR